MEKTKKIPIDKIQKETERFRKRLAKSGVRLIKAEFGPLVKER